MSDRQFAAIYTESTYIEGDERSRTNPGHGYPAHTVSHQVYHPFKSEAEMRAWVDREERSTYGKKEYQIIEAIPLKVTTTVQVEIK